MDEGEVALELDLLYVHERIWDPVRRSSLQAGRITSTKASSQCGHDRYPACKASRPPINEAPWLLGHRGISMFVFVYSGVNIACIRC